MAANLAHFALHVDDLDRAQRFYRAVFGWSFEAWGPPGFHLIHTGDADDPGIGGAMHVRHAPRVGTGLNGVEATFAVSDLDAVVAAVTAHGGRVTLGPTPIPTVGVLARFEDPEGNEMGAMVYDRAPPSR